MFWDEQRVETLLRLHQEGLSATVIAERIGAQSRSAVIGKLHRIGAPKRPSIIRKKAHVQSQRKPRSFVTQAPRIAPVKARTWSPVPVDGTPLPDPQATDIPRISIEKLEPHHCRWPCAEHKSNDAPIYCGCTPVPGLPYCEDHARRAYQPPQPRKAPSTPAERTAATVKPWALKKLMALA